MIVVNEQPLITSYCLASYSSVRQLLMYVSLIGSYGGGAESLMNNNFCCAKLHSGSFLAFYFGRSAEKLEKFMIPTIYPPKL